jgi:tetratricopeptide (TPR) repeat protein
VICIKVATSAERGRAAKIFGKTAHNELCMGGKTMSNHLDYEINKELGECYLFMGDMDKAEDYYRKAVDANTGNASPYLGLAAIAIQRGSLQDALALYTKAASLEPSDKSLSGVGLVKMELGAHEEAFSCFRQALDHNPENAVALNCIVREGYHLSRLEEVVPYLQMCLDGAPDKEAVRVTLAGCLMSLGKNEDARRHLETVLGDNPANAGAQELFDNIAAA